MKGIRDNHGAEGLAPRNRRLPKTPSESRSASAGCSETAFERLRRKQRMNVVWGHWIRKHWFALFAPFVFNRTTRLRRLRRSSHILGVRAVQTGGLTEMRDEACEKPFWISLAAGSTGDAGRVGDVPMVRSESGLPE